MLMSSYINKNSCRFKCSHFAGELQELSQKQDVQEHRQAFTLTARNSCATQTEGVGEAQQPGCAALWAESDAIADFL